MRYLVTGGCGFIGSNLIHYLLATQPDVHIRIFDNLCVGSKETLSRICDYVEIDSSQLPRESSDQVELIVGDILNRDIIASAFSNVDVVVHLAANTGVPLSVENPYNDCLINVVGTLNCLEAARQNQVKRFVFASSNAPIGGFEGAVHEELVPHPVSPYGASKMAGEGYCSVYYHTFGLQTVALRFANVYGPGSRHKSSVVAKFIQEVYQGKNLEIYGDGLQTRDFIYVEDLVQAIVQASIVDGVAGELFQIATGIETTLMELADQLLSIMIGSGIPEVSVTHGPIRQGDIRKNVSDPSKAQRLLNWCPHTPLQEGLQKTVRWFLHSNSNES